MASRESQGLQVALILFVMVTVVLAVTTYFFFREAEERTAQAAAARAEAEQFNNAAPAPCGDVLLSNRHPSSRAPV